MAQIITVTNINDSGAGSLREAIATAETGDKITFDPSLENQTITLTSGQLEIDKDLIIDGVDAAGLTISGNNAQRIISVPDQGVETSVTIKNLAFIDGFTTEGGGAIQGERNVTLTIENSEFKNNVAGGGGAIMPGPETTTTIINSKFDGNEAKPEQSSTLEIFDGGGAIKVFVLSDLIIKNSEFTNNKGTLGGAINSLGTNLTIENSAFVNNDSTAGQTFGDFGQGGAIYTDGASLNDGAATSGEVIIRDTVFDGNKAAGGGGAAFLFGYESDKYAIEGSTFVNNSTTDNGQGENGLGGGIRFGRNSELKIENTTFANNTSTHQAGGLWSDGDAITTINNSTFSGNTAGGVSDDGSLNGFGGAMTLFGNSTITNSTIANNSSGFVAGAIFSSDLPITVTNTIFDNNTAGNGLISQNTNRELTDGGGNIQFPDKLTTNDPNDNNATANITIADPQLGELQEINGRLVHPLQAGSPAIDAGTNTNAPTTDQRGQQRPIDGDGNGSQITDTGAYEFVAETATGVNLRGTNAGERLVGTPQQDTLAGAGGNDTLVGRGNGDLLRGGAGRDRLNGGSGADTMRGGAGNDFYIVDDSNDRVIENPDEGADKVLSRVSYRLPVNLERLVLGTKDDLEAIGNSTDNRITGNGGNNKLVGAAGKDTIFGNNGSDTLSGGGDRDILIGNAGNDLLAGHRGSDRLNGGSGRDTMRGGAGNDLYFVNSSDDQVIENADEGKDTVKSSATYRLPDNLERLVLTGKDDVDGIGNSLDNRMAGNSGNNQLSGAAGNDTIFGTGGRDTLGGGGGHDILLGGTDRDVLKGHRGSDRLNGFNGDDTLTGGLGADLFIFNTNERYRRDELGTDAITDFTQGDQILLDRRTFTAITSDKGDGFSAGSEFEVVESNAAAATSDAVVVYNQTNGNLFYNPNGSNSGLGSGGLFATLTDAPALAESDFLIR